VSAEKLLGTLFIGIILLALVMWIGPPMVTRYRADIIAEKICVDSGYQVNKLINNAYYCVTFGMEPSIIRLGTKWELAKLYGK